LKNLFVISALVLLSASTIPVFAETYEERKAYCETVRMDFDHCMQKVNIEPENQLGVCTAHYDPVTSTDGETFSNLCMLESAGAEFGYKGEFVEPSQETLLDKIFVLMVQIIAGMKTQ